MIIVVAVWLLMAYFLIREIAYETLEEKGNIPMVDWIGMIIGLTIGAPLLFFMMLAMADRKNLRKAFFMSPVKKPRQARDFIRVRMFLGKLFAIKE